MNISKETIWHFTCKYCKGFWSIAVMDEWAPKKLFCPHCGEINEVKFTHKPKTKVGTHE